MISICFFIWLLLALLCVLAVAAAAHKQAFSPHTADESELRRTYGPLNNNIALGNATLGDRFPASAASGLSKLRRGVGTLRRWMASLVLRLAATQRTGKPAKYAIDEKRETGRVLTSGRPNGIETPSLSYHQIRRSILKKILRNPEFRLQRAGQDGVALARNSEHAGRSAKSLTSEALEVSIRRLPSSAKSAGQLAVTCAPFPVSPTNPSSRAVKEASSLGLLLMVNSQIS